MLEWYRTGADYKDIMTDCENLILSLIKSSTSDSPSTLSYQSHIIDLSPPWPRLSVNELFINHCQIDLLQHQDLATFTQAAVDVDVQHSVVAGRDLAEAETSESVARPIEEVTLSSPAANCSNLLVSEQFAAGDESVASAASSEVTWQSCWTPVHCAVAGEGQQEEITSVDLGEQEGDLEDSSRVAGNIGPLPCSGSSGPDGATRTAAVQNSVEPSASNSAAAGVVCGRGRGVRRRSSLKRSSSIFFPSEDEAEYERKKSKVFV